MSRRTPLRALVLALSAALALGSCDPQEQHEDLTFKEPIHRVILHNDIGPVRVVASEREDLRVQRVANGWRGRLALSSRVQGDTLVLDARCAGFLPCTVDTVLLIPPGTDVSIQQGTGDVLLDGVDGVVDVDLASGTLRGRALAPRELAIAVAEGDLMLALERAPEHLNAAVGAGDVEIRLPEGRYQYDVRSADGMVSGVEATKTDADAPRIEVTVARGDIRLPSV